MSFKVDKVDKEEIQEVSVSLAAAKESSIDAAAAAVSSKADGIFVLNKEKELW